MEKLVDNNICDIIPGFWDFELMEMNKIETISIEDRIIRKKCKKGEKELYLWNISNWIVYL